MLDIKHTNRYKKDVKLMNKQGKNKNKLTIVLSKLISETVLEEKYKDHMLSGQYEGCRECHIEPDWLLIYKVDKVQNVLYLVRTGSHSNLFECFIENSMQKQLVENFVS